MYTIPEYFLERRNNANILYRNLEQYFFGSRNKSDMPANQ